MSYARLGDDCNVYVYLDVGGFLNCCFCSLQRRSFHAFATQAMLDHLQRHRDVGDIVPDDIDGALCEDSGENDRWMADGPYIYDPATKEHVKETPAVRARYDQWLKWVGLPHDA